MEIGRLIKLRRQELKMTQEELAQAAGTTKSAISYYELGRRTPRIGQLQAISQVLGLSLQELVEEPNEPRITIEFTPGGDAVPDEVEWTEEEYFNEVLRGRDAGLQDVYYKQITSSWSKLSMDGKREAAKRVLELTRLEEYQASPERDEGTDALCSHDTPFGNDDED